MSLREIADAANDLASLLESAAGRGLRHPKHARHILPAREKIEKVIVHFFERQKRAVLQRVEPHIKRELVLYPPKLKESSQQGKTFARTLVPSNLQPLTFAATAAETSEYNDAITSLIVAAAKGMSASEAAGEDYAGEYLQSNSLSKLTGGLNETSIGRLQDALAKSWDDGGTFDSMVSAIEDEFDDFSTSRSELIAQNEANHAYNFGRESVARDVGMDEQSWTPDGTDCCELCQENVDAGWIDIDEDFPNEDPHPGCDCGRDFRKSSESEDEEE